MNYSDYICFDFETTGKNPNTAQPIQIAAVVIHGRKLEIKEGTEFQSLIRPNFDEYECKQLNLDPLTDDSIAIHGKTRELLQTAPSPKSVWSNFSEYCKQYNHGKSNFTAPIATGYNINSYDMVIVDRLCSKAPYNFGPVNKEGGQDIFNRIKKIDMLDFMFALFENNSEVNSLSADNLFRGYMGYAKGQAHDAMSDTIMVAEIFCRTMKLMRRTASSTRFKGVFNE